MSPPGNRSSTSAARRGGSATGSKKAMGPSDIPAFLVPGTDVSAKFRGAFCEAKIQGFDSEIIEIWVNTKNQSIPPDHVYHQQDVQGNLEIGETVMVSYKKQSYEGVITHVRDLSRYKIVFNDGDEKVLRRNQMVLKGEKHYDAQSNLDNMPLLNPDASRHKQVMDETLLGSSRSCTRQIQALVDSEKKEAQSESTSTMNSLSDVSSLASSSAGSSRTGIRSRKHATEKSETPTNLPVTDAVKNTKNETENQTSKTEVKRQKKRDRSTFKSTSKQAIAIVRSIQLSSNVQCSSPVQSTSYQSKFSETTVDAHSSIGSQGKAAKLKSEDQKKPRTENFKKRMYKSSSTVESSSTETITDESPPKQMRTNLSTQPSSDEIVNPSEAISSISASTKTFELVQLPESSLIQTDPGLKHSIEAEEENNNTKLKRQLSQSKTDTFITSAEPLKKRRKSTQLQTSTQLRSSSPKPFSSTTQSEVFEDESSPLVDNPSTSISTVHEISTDVLLEVEQIKMEANASHEIKIPTSVLLRSMIVNAVALQPKLSRPLEDITPPESPQLTVDVENVDDEDTTPSALSAAARLLQNEYENIGGDALLLAITNQIQGDELINTFEEDDTKPETNFIPNQRQLSSIDLNGLQSSISNCRAIMKPLSVKIGSDMQQSFLASSSLSVQQTEVSSGSTSSTQNFSNTHGSMSLAKSQPFIPLCSPNNSLEINLPALSPNTKLRRSPAQQTLQAVLNQPSQSSKFVLGHNDDQQTRLLQCLQSQQHSSTLRSPFNTTNKLRNQTRLPAMLTSINTINQHSQASVPSNAAMNTFPANAGRSTQEIWSMNNVLSQNALYANNILLNPSIHSILCPQPPLQFPHAFQQQNLYVKPNFSLDTANQLFKWHSEAQNQWLMSINSRPDLAQLNCQTNAFYNAPPGTTERSVNLNEVISAVAEFEAAVSKNAQAAGTKIVLPTSQKIQLVGVVTKKPCEDCGSNPSVVEMHLLNMLPEYFRTEVLDMYARTHRRTKDRKSRPQCNLKGLSKQAQRQVVEKRRHEDRMEELRRLNGHDFLMIDSKFSHSRQTSKPPLLTEIMSSIGYDSTDANRLPESKEICYATEQHIDNMDSQEVRSNVMKLINEESPNDNTLAVLNIQNVERLREYINNMSLVAERENVRLIMANHNLEMTDEFEKLLQSTQECIVNGQKDFEAEEERLLRRAVAINRYRRKCSAHCKRKG
ncbi:hypothetical protein M3Y96_00900500 [Aphelenchoides besseyi]|nr:hypothetical protein M3Y96_00900500 [Aphelenchoides besseyi]